MRLMVWNINRFTHNSLNRNMPYNQWYILETVTQQALDIFVIVEVQSSQGLRGSLIRSGGRTGSLELLGLLRDEEPGADWRLVPALKLVHGIIGQNYTEGISVFYRNATLDFVGPYYWDQNQGIATPANAGTNYPAPWGNALPVGNNRAGKVNFVRYDNPGTVLEFPNANNRRPFQTNFTERGGAARNIRVFSAHLPPNQANAAAALNQISLINDVRVVGANDVVIVAGDFNFDLAQIGQTHLDDVRFFSLANYFLPIQFTLATGATRIEDTNNATIAGAAPGYGYLLGQYIDNIFVRYGGGLVAPAHNPIVINRVVGSPPYGVDMLDSIPNILAMGALTAQQKLDLFREEESYGHIARYAGVSDHLPLVIDF